MAHSCPDCGQTCYCNGDIDDCLFDFDEDSNNCTHFQQCANDMDDGDYFDGDEYDGALIA